MLKKFENNKIYKIKTWDELIKCTGVYKQEEDYLSTHEGDYFYLKSMDQIENRTFHGALTDTHEYDLSYHDGYYKDEVVEPWMCEEIKQCNK